MKISQPRVQRICEDLHKHTCVKDKETNKRGNEQNINNHIALND